MIEWFDDLKIGMRFRTGETTVSEEDIKRFASEFDPQPFHLDKAAAENTVFKGLIASGWHTAAIVMGSGGCPVDCACSDLYAAPFLEVVSWRDTSQRRFGCGRR